MPPTHKIQRGKSMINLTAPVGITKLRVFLKRGFGGDVDGRWVEIKPLAGPTVSRRHHCHDVRQVHGLFNVYFKS
jgi:hypothetical protein